MTYNKPEYDVNKKVCKKRAQRGNKLQKKGRALKQWKLEQIVDKLKECYFNCLFEMKCLEIDESIDSRKQTSSIHQCAQKSSS